MAEHADKSDEELASACILGACQLIYGPYFVLSDQMHNLVGSTLPATTEYVIECGSYAEFYIHPPNPCIGDLDVLIARTDELVVTGDFPVLPGHMGGLADTIKCFKIEPYDRYPGFVRLQIFGEMSYDWNCNSYTFNHTAVTNSYAILDLDSIADSFHTIALKRSTSLKRISGPAVKQLIDEHIDLCMLFDCVRSMWCPQWPNEAQGWLNRPRLNGWPTNDIISEVVQNGCHVVCVQHRSCRDDKLQWRFSFSLAEIILLQSWTPKQQIVYHLLRFFAKRELIQKNCRKEDEVLCPYHLKTLMLWTCEEMSPKWWNSASIIWICCELLNRLAEWLKKTYCRNYFIPEANLFQDLSSSKILAETATQLNKYSNSGILSHWFLENYILIFIRRHFKPMTKMPNIVDYMLSVSRLFKLNQLHSLQFYFYKLFAYSHVNCRNLVRKGLNVGMRQCLTMQYKCRRYGTMDLKTNARKRDRTAIQNVSCFMYHGNLLYILHIAYSLGCGEISWDGSLWVEAIVGISKPPKIMRSAYHNFPRPHTSLSSRLQFQRAQDLMDNMTGTNSYSEFQLLSLMAKQFIKKALKYDGTLSNRILPVALCYLAALHYSDAEYQEAMSLCSAVLMTSEEDKETLNAGCLLFMDDVARIVGLCVLQKRIRENNLHCINRRLYLDLRLSPEVLAKYLSVVSDERMSKQSDLSDSLFPLDVNLKALMKHKFIYSKKSVIYTNAARHIVYRRPNSVIEPEPSSVNPSIVKERVLDALMEYAVENMASFYQVLCKDFGYKCTTIDCYRALFLYKCGQKYDQVLRLCEQILIDPDHQKEWREFSFANVLLLPPLDSFFDRDVQSLLGFHTLSYYLSPLNDDLRKTELNVESTFEHWFALKVHRDKSDLLFVLENLYPIRSHYFLGRHFLARYLKLRCCFDCNLPYSDALTEFAVHKTNFPFEHIIRRYLLQRLRISKK